MITRSDIIKAAHDHGFDDIGFTTADPFPEHRQLLLDSHDEYAWAERAGLDLIGGTDPTSILPDAKTIIVLMEVYFKKAYPRSLEGTFGRCYLDDDRVTKEGLAKRIKAFRQFLRDEGIESRVPFNLPHRVAAARAGLGTFGLCDGLITARGKAMRTGSIVAKVSIEPTPRPYANHQAYCLYYAQGTCGKCIDRCPVRAITQAGHDKEKCRQHLAKSREYVKKTYQFEGYGCGLCQVGVPCEAGIPVRAARKALERGELPPPPPPLA